MQKLKDPPKKHAPIESSPAFRSHPTYEEIRVLGKSLRDKCPRDGHAVWKAPHDRADPLVLMEEANKGRIAHLIPVRHGRMLKSPFTFYRGAALNMAAAPRSWPTHLDVVIGTCYLRRFLQKLREGLHSSGMGSGGTGGR